MARIKRALVLSYPHLRPNVKDGSEPVYRIERIKNSTSFHPHELLCKGSVQDLCREGWEVLIKARDGQ